MIEQKGLVQSAIVVGLLCALAAFGSVALQLRGGDRLQVYSESQLEQLEHLGRGGSSVARLRKLHEDQRTITERYRPLQIGTLVPYGLCALLLAWSAMRAQGTPQAARSLGLAAAVAAAARLLVGAVEWSAALAMAPGFRDSVGEGFRVGLADTPSGVQKVLSVYGAFAGGELLTSPLAWTAAICSYFAWVALVFLRRPERAP